MSGPALVIGEQELGPMEKYFAHALKRKGVETRFINIHSLYRPVIRKLSSYSWRFPRKIDNYVQRKYLMIINRSLMREFDKVKPECVFVYNDCKLLPETLKKLKKTGTKVVILLGDDPNFTVFSKKLFVLTVMHADAVITPDTGWIDGLRMLGVKNIIYSPIGTDPNVFYPMIPNESQKTKYSCEVLFVGCGYYVNGHGLRRAALLNELCGFNFKLFGSQDWYELFQYFPALKRHFVEARLPAQEVNVACNCAKIYPVLINAGVRNGASTRIFDCIASGIFILSEYRKDIETLFPNNEVVMFHCRQELKDKVTYFLKHESERQDHIKAARDLVLKKYTLDVTIEQILEELS